MQQSDVNLMTARNLGVVFGPTLMRSQDAGAEFTDMAGKALTVEWLVENAPTVFNKPDVPNWRNLYDYYIIFQLSGYSYLKCLVCHLESGFSPHICCFSFYCHTQLVSFLCLLFLSLFRWRHSVDNPASIYRDLYLLFFQPHLFTWKSFVFYWLQSCFTHRTQKFNPLRQFFRAFWSWRRFGLEWTVQEMSARPRSRNCTCRCTEWCGV